MTNHHNDERTVRCPVDGCDATPLARGINLHLRRSSGNGHGPQGEVPDNVSTDNLETVGEREVEMDYPEERDTENVARLCPYCSQPYQGKNGVLIHLGQMAGRKNHPEDAAKGHSEEDFPIVELDDQQNIISVADDPAPETADPETDAVPIQRVYRLIAVLVADGKSDAARRVRHHLLGEDTVSRPHRTVPPHRELYEALVSQAHADQPDDHVTAAVEADGISVTCRGESGLLTADEARDIAAGLAQSSVGDDDEIAQFVDFLRCGADLLELNQQESRTTDFKNWR